MNRNRFEQLRARLGRPLIMAHRGASALLPENSMSAFEQAVADGANVIETDLHFTSDDHLVLIHDSTLERTVQAGGPVRAYSRAELDDFQLKQPPHRQGQVERVPSLHELIDLTGPDTGLALELKADQFTEPAYTQRLIKLLRDRGVIERCAVISFDKHKLAVAKALEPALATGWITMINPLPNQPTDLLGPLWPLLRLNPFYVRWAHRLGKIVAPLDPAPDSRVKLYLKLGVDLLLTDNPKKTLAALEAQTPQAGGRGG